MNKEEIFKSKAAKTHGDKYDYSLVSYKNSHTKVLIICKIHGVFPMVPHAHIGQQKQGCPECGLLTRRLPHKKTNDKFIAEAKEAWGDRYDYSETQYINKAKKIKYFCPIHGEQEQMPYLHIKHGCQYCSGRGISRHSKASYEAIAIVVYNGKYDYSKMNFKRVSSEIEIICPIHGSFFQRADNHIHLGNGCQKCGANVHASKGQREIADFISNVYNESILVNDRDALGGKEIDVYLPGINFGVEYHGIYWHLETVLGRKYHLDKHIAATSAGIRLLQIYDLEWINKKEIVKSKIINCLGRSKKIFARKTSIVGLNKHDKDKFLSQNHVQGSDSSKIHYGLTYNGEIVACMTFGPSRFNRGYDYELLRFCSKNYVSVVGGASKLLNHFRKNYDGSIISYADKRYSDGNLYRQIGFTLDGETKPSFSVFNISKCTLHSRLSFRRNDLKKFKEYDDSLSAYEIMQLSGFDRIWDCGQYRFVMM